MIMLSNESIQTPPKTLSVGMDGLIERVEEIYRQIDRETGFFSAASGIRCLEGCGICCRSEKVEASVLEMLPLARSLFYDGPIEAWIEPILNASPQGPCLFFQADARVTTQGRCGRYRWRPLVCRMYGYAARNDKHGKPIFSPCRIIKSLFPDAAAMAAIAVGEKLPIPRFSDFHLRAAAVEPNLGNPPLPINRALQLAVERYGLAWHLSRSDVTAPVVTWPEAKAGGADRTCDDPCDRLPPRLAA
jgi:Fe-S-cluster containining protein